MDTVMDVQMIKTDEGAKDGQSKCPNCGSTDISTNPNTGKLRCNFCRTEFEPETAEPLVDNIEDLQGEVIASGASDIDHSAEQVITLKCQSCGADVVIDTESVTQARCHWCRSILSINSRIENGAVPDAILPFSIKKEQAKQEIETVEIEAASEVIAHMQQIIKPVIFADQGEIINLEDMNYGND